MRSSSSRRSGPSDERGDRRPRAPRRRAPLRSADVGQARAGAARVERRAPSSSSRTSPARCGAQPRHAAELHGVRDLVERHPAQQLVGLGLERAGGVAEVGRDEQQPRGRGRDRAAGTRTGRARGRRGSRRSRRPRRRAARRRAGADDAAERAEPAAQAVGDRVEHALQRRRGWPPTHASRPTASAAGSGASGVEPGVGGDEPRALRGGAVEGLERRRIAGGLQARDAAGDLRGERPVDHPPMVAGSRINGGPERARASPSRRARGDDGRVRLEVQRRAERRPRSAVKATSPPRLAHDQLRGGGVDRAAAPQRDHRRRARARRPGTARRRSCRSRAAGGVARRSASARLARSSAGRRTRSRRARACPSRVRRSPAAGRARTPSRNAPSAAHGATHSSLGPEVEDVAEDDVGHRRPVGDRDRQRVVGQAALGVHRAVDRVDDHERRRRRRSRPSPRSSETRVKRAPLVVQALELGEDGVLGRGVDHRASGRRPRRACRSRRTRSAVVGCSREDGAQRRRAGRRQAPSQSAWSDGHRGRILGGADVLAAAQREAVDARAAVPCSSSAARAPARRRVLVERFAWLVERRARRPRRSSCSRLRPPPTTARADRGRGWAAPLRGARGHHRSRRSARGCCTTRRSRPASTRSPRPSPRPTGWRCCSSASTSCRCAATTCAATRARCSARSSAASTGSRTSS